MLSTIGKEIKIFAKMSSEKIHKNFYSLTGKRLFDLALTAVALILLLPVLIIVALLIHFNLGRPVLFRQMRPGMNEKPFAIFKFRSMTNARDQRGNLLPDSQRLNHLGAFLRKTSIDELPELINVLKGDMSLVGPRPLLMEYLPYYSERERLRHTVRPGITGLAQVSGRNYLLWDDRLEVDVKYIENVSLVMDIKIIFQTIVQVIKTKDVAVVPGRLGVPLSVERQTLKKKKV